MRLGKPKTNSSCELQRAYLHKMILLTERHPSRHANAITYGPLHLSTLHPKVEREDSRNSECL